VRDSRTKAPIAGATVAPLVFTPPSVSPDQDREVKTGADGRYEVRGVEPGNSVYVDHPEYVRDPEFRDDKRNGQNQDIFLKPAPTIVLTVVDSKGQPLEGATVRWNTRQAPSGKDGRLAVRDPSMLHSLTIHKDGYIDRDLEVEDIRRELAEPRGLVVVMKPTIALSGRVIAPDGRPVAAFTVAAGAGKLPSRRQSVRRDVQGHDGRFSLSLSQEDTSWVGVAAEGFAAWEGWVEVKRGGEPLEVRLSPGVAVSGRLVAPESMRKLLKARLVPRRDTSDSVQAVVHGSATPAEELPTRTATPAVDGTLHFEHVRPDRYLLILDGRGVPRTNRALDVPAAGLDHGIVMLELPTATGRVAGRVWRPKNEGGKPWAFAEGYVRGPRVEGPGNDDAWHIAFIADENGRFEVDRVPVGLTTVAFPYPRSADVIDAHTWSALVVEGQTTQVRAFDPDESRAFTLAFVIGDGSEAQYASGTGLGAARQAENITTRDPMFRVELVPLPSVPRSFAKPDWVELDAQRKLVLPDVGPGRYQLRVYDWHGGGWPNREPLFDREMVVPPGGLGEVRVALGAGCITGKAPAPKEDFQGFVEVTALAKGSRTPSRRTRCDNDGNFCVRYLSPGTYRLFIHNPQSGFCRVDDVEVPAGVVDVGERTLSAGATVRGAIHFVRLSRVPDEVVAFHTSGVSVHQWFSNGSSFDRVELAGLWPGHWTVSARSGDQVLATSALDVEGSGTLQVTLMVPSQPLSGPRARR
jgi:hypothetical protein